MKWMTVEDVKKRVEKIWNEFDDDEAAHIDEDKLYTDVLIEIANGNPYAKELAREAIKVVDMDFCRWYV